MFIDTIILGVLTTIQLEAEHKYRNNRNLGISLQINKGITKSLGAKESRRNGIAT
jgi:hypothetical protein